MGTEEKSPESVVHRPLPAVEIPLLREHRRASRARQLAVGGAVALAMAGAITASLLTEDAPVESSEGSPLASTPTAGAPPRRNGLAATADAPAADSPASPLPPAAEAPRLEPGPGPSAEPPQTAGATTRTSQPFGEARGFRPALLAAGLEAAECAELEAALADQMDFRRCRPEHELIVERDSEGTLLRFEYHGSRT
ncbi:MAG: hypothetical protein OEY14_17840, partial [Myxococcales bacterium]|nr:hypothetical protein [Myxococcales bacterium]